MELIVGTNCYFDVQQANKIIEDNLMSMSTERKFWESLSDSDKTNLIYSNTQLCDNNAMLYKGVKQDTKQSMQFPRVINGDVVECPDSIKLGILLNGIKDTSVNIADASFTSMKLAGIKSFADGSGARVEFGGSSDEVTSDLDKITNGVYRDIFLKYFIEYSKLC